MIFVADGIRRSESSIGDRRPSPPRRKNRSEGARRTSTRNGPPRPRPDTRVNDLMRDRFEPSSAGPFSTSRPLDARETRASGDRASGDRASGDRATPLTDGGAVDPNASLYQGAYDGVTLPEGALKALFEGPPSEVQRHIARGRIRPDDIRKARTLDLIDDRTAQALANQSLDALAQAGVADLPEEIRYTQSGPFYFRLNKDDASSLTALKTALRLDPDRRASQTTNAEEDDWDFATLERMKAEGRLEVVDRFGRPVDIFSTTAIDGRPEHLINLKVRYRSADYEADPVGGDTKRTDALDGDFVMIEAWNHDLSRPKPSTIYEVPAYDWPGVDEQDTDRWRFETLAEPDRQGRGRVGHVSGQINLVTRPRQQIADRLRTELGEEPDEATLNEAVRAHDRAKGWAKNRGMHYVRYREDQTPAGNRAMIDAGMRDPDQGVPYSRSQDRYNGGHVIAASFGGFGEGLNVTAQAEGNNQDRFARFTVAGDDGTRQTLSATESWHDWERHMKNLALFEDEGLTLGALEAQGFVVPASVRERYGPDERIRFDVRTSIRSWYEDEATLTEDPRTRHTREFARFTSTQLIDQETGERVASLTMANYNVGSSDSDYAQKMQMLFTAGFIDRDGGYADNADMRVFQGSEEPPPDVRGAGTLDESMPTTEDLKAFVDSMRFQSLWGPNVRP